MIDDIKISSIEVATFVSTKICTACNTSFTLGEDLISDEEDLIITSPCDCYLCQENE